jgi:hypothetical protein
MPPPADTTKLVWLGLVASASGGISLTAFFFIQNSPQFMVTGLLLPIVGFAVLAFVARWLIVPNTTTSSALGERTVLLFGGAKLVLFLAVLLLALECLFGAIVWPTSRHAMLSTFVIGMVGFAALNIGLTGIANTLAIARKLWKRTAT